MSMRACLLAALVALAAVASAQENACRHVTAKINPDGSTTVYDYNQLGLIVYAIPFLSGVLHFFSPFFSALFSHEKHFFYA